MLYWVQDIYDFTSNNCTRCLLDADFERFFSGFNEQDFSYNPFLAIPIEPWSKRHYFYKKKEKNHKKTVYS